MSMAHIRRRRNVPAQRGMRVTVNGKPGRITSSRGACHPRWRVTYHTQKGDVVFS